MLAEVTVSAQAAEKVKASVQKVKDKAQAIVDEIEVSNNIFLIKSVAKDNELGVASYELLGIMTMQCSCFVSFFSLFFVKLERAQIFTRLTGK